MDCGAQFGVGGGEGGAVLVRLVGATFGAEDRILRRPSAISNAAPTLQGSAQRAKTLPDSLQASAPLHPCEPKELR